MNKLFHNNRAKGNPIGYVAMFLVACLYYYFIGPLFNLVFLCFSWKWKIKYMFYYMGLVGFNR